MNKRGTQTISSIISVARRVYLDSLTHSIYPIPLLIEHLKAAKKSLREKDETKGIIVIAHCSLLLLIATGSR